MKKIIGLIIFLSFSIQVSADNLSNSIKLFNWAEGTFADYFNPPTTTVQADTLFYRFYSGTNTYLGTVGNDVYLYSPSLLGEQVVKVGVVSDFVQVADVSWLTFNFNESTPGSGSTVGTITFNSDGTFKDDATNNSGHFIATGTWVQNGSELTIHFTSYQYDGSTEVQYDGSTMTGQLIDNLGTLSDASTTMNLTSLVQ